MTEATERRIRFVIAKLGDFCCEASVLILVFVPLDYLLAKELTIETVSSTLAVSVGSLGLGIVLGLAAVEEKVSGND